MKNKLPNNGGKSQHKAFEYRLREVEIHKKLDILRKELGTFDLELTIEELDELREEGKQDVI